MRVFCAFLAIGCVGLLLGCSSGDDDDSGSPSASGGSGGTSSTSSTGGAAGEPASSADDCHVGCVATLAADCEQGPTDQASCESDCHKLLAGTCGSEYATLQTCAEGEPITCSAGYPIIAACSDQQAAFVACLND